MLAIDENQVLLPGVSVQAEPVRYYPQGETTANIVGYVSGITGSEYTQDKTEKCGTGVPCYQTDLQVGQAGVEASFEKYLRGTPGVEELQVDSQGNVLGLLSYTPPVPGDNLVLSHLAERPAGGGPGLERLGSQGEGDDGPGEQCTHDFRAPGASMVVEDPRNGQILALATNPDYNPSDFLGRHQRDAKWEYYNNPANNFPTYRPGGLDRLCPRFHVEADHRHRHAPLRLAHPGHLLRRHSAPTRSAGRSSRTTTTRHSVRSTWPSA